MFVSPELKTNEIPENKKTPGQKTVSAEHGLDADSGSACINFISDDMAGELGLDPKDLTLIGGVLKALLDGKDLSATDILKELENDTREVFRAVDRLQRLMDSGVIETARVLDDRSNAVELLRSNLRITDAFFRKVFCENAEDATTEAEIPYEDNNDYLADQFERIRWLEEIDGRFALKSSNRWRSFKPSEQNQKEKMLQDLEEKIERRLAASNKGFPFEKFIKERKLARNEEIIVLALLRKEVFGGSGYEVNELLHLIARSPRERLDARELFDKEGKLLKGKILKLDSRRFSSDLYIRLNSRMSDMLLCKNKKARRSKSEKDEIFETVKPHISLENVILHPKTHKDILSSVKIMEDGVARRLADWGFKGRNLSEASENKKHLAVTLLFYGAPGTGKTLTAHAVASKLGKAVLSFDCSRVLNKWVGDSEKNTRSIFDRYRELAGRKRNPPVLLLNEADQFLHRRISAERSADHMYNQMQNIFLEQLECFSGILIATTNLVESFDPAFSRRFSQKIEFMRPRPEDRLRLWQVHMPVKAPIGKDVDLRSLALKYDFSGGQIALVVNNAATRAAIRGDRIWQEDLVISCEDELKGNFDEKASRIGFNN